MKTELLIIKYGDNYLRVKNDHYELCALDKASVFPMEKLDIVRDHLDQIIARGMAPAHIKKLILTEEAFHKTDDETDTDRP
jgi:hypothetical protein